MKQIEICLLEEVLRRLVGTAYMICELIVMCQCISRTKYDQNHLLIFLRESKLAAVCRFRHKKTSCQRHVIPHQF